MHVNCAKWATGKITGLHPKGSSAVGKRHIEKNEILMGYLFLKVEKLRT
jgi:hypothetical protein